MVARSARVSTVGKSLHKTSYKKEKESKSGISVSALFLFSGDLHATISLWAVDTPSMTKEIPSPSYRPCVPSPAEKRQKSKIRR